MSYKSIKEVIDLLRLWGFEFISQKGSHAKYSDGKHTVVIPMHGKKGIEKGTYFSILRQAGRK